MNDHTTQNSQVLRISLLLAAVLVAGAVGWWYWQRPAQAEAAVATPPTSPEVAVPAAEAPGIRHPLAEAGTPEAAPAAATEEADPDAVARAGLESLFGGPELAAWLIPEHLVRRLVATTDNLSRATRTEQLRPLRAPAGPLVVQREVIDAAVGAERITLDARNASRYDVPVALLTKTDMGQAAILYRRLYPLLQRAYEDLGYPDRYFNDRVVDTIDHLLATPEPPGPLLLEQPKVLYRFADPELEARSAGQKLLLRMGVAHARVVKQKLREFRQQIASKE
jgi:hypothetical protein